MSLKKNLIEIKELIYKKKYKSALIRLEEIHEYFPEHREIKEMLAFVQLASGNYAISRGLYMELLKNTNCTAESMYGYGSILFQGGAIEYAIEIFEEAYGRCPNQFEIIHDLATCKALVGKTIEALDLYKQAGNLNPNSAELMYNIGRLYDEMRDEESAVEFYKRAIGIDQQLVDAWINLGLNFIYLKKFYDGSICLKKALDLDPERPFIFGDLMHAKMHIGEWDDYNKNIQYLTNQIKLKRKVIHPFHLLSLVQDEALQKIAAEIYANEKYAHIGITNDMICNKKRNKKGNKRIKVGYFSADFKNHATSYLSAELFELHNKEIFEIYAFSYSRGENDSMRKRLENTFDKFIDVSKKSNGEIICIAREAGIDIAVDMSGHTQDSRTEIFVKRVAPIQINFLVYPGTMGMNVYDYIIADKIVIPEGSKKYYCEEVLYMPNTYQVNGRISTFEERGSIIIDQEFVFCCFNNCYKINPEIFDLWMEILINVDNSVLWILSSNTKFQENIISQAEKKGVCQKRIKFFEIVNRDEHLKRHKEINLFLDTFPYGAHTTASDALRMGIPVLTIMGKSFQSRVASSLLNALGMNELIVDSKHAYVDMAVKLAKNQPLLRAINNKLLDALQAGPVFDTQKYAKDLEELYCKVQLKKIKLH